jgi:hypothetical protein
MMIQIKIPSPITEPITIATIIPALKAVFAASTTPFTDDILLEQVMKK